MCILYIISWETLFQLFKIQHTSKCNKIKLNVEEDLHVKVSWKDIFLIIVLSMCPLYFLELN